MKSILKALLTISLLMPFTRTVYAESLWTKVPTITPMIWSIEQSPWGILAGEFGNYTSINGIYLSKDLGHTWSVLGLQKRGVQDIKYFQGKIYVTTYYVVDNKVGLFVSEDKGSTWNKIGPSGTATKVTRDSKTIYLGMDQSGLWISQDEGQTWTQKIGNGVDGTKIYFVESSENVAFAATGFKVFKSTDKGNTWTEIPYLTSKYIMNLYINGNVVFAGAQGALGLYVSTDTGKTWNKVVNFGNYPVGGITYFNNRYYVGRENPTEQNYSIYYTTDLGNTWVDTHMDPLTTERVFELAWIHSDTSYLFATAYNYNVYRYQVPKEDFLKLPIFDIPWSYQNVNELVDKITSYFDHSFPLLGYAYYSEPESENTTTLNFLGIKNTEPYIYYTSHSGTDFALKYGTEIKAPASGYATYYYCKSCGNTIKIDHLNGYQTTYMHLQDDGLITKTGQIWVNNNDIIGRVGMTGNTSGPHLHFEVLKDANQNNNFLDDYPSGRVDPFGWQDLKNTDPWKKYFWTDLIGNHQGTESIYLWKNMNGSISKFIEGSSSNSNVITLDNKKITFTNIVENITAKITPYIRPTNPPLNSTKQVPMEYLEATSFLSEAFDQLENKKEIFEDPIQIEIALTQSQISNLILDTIRLYFWNEISKIWESVPSIFNSDTNTLTSTVNHFSWFAVFGEKIENNILKTQISVSGSQSDVNIGWFIEFPLVTLSPTEAEEPLTDNIFYSINDGETWDTYSMPFLIQKEGITNVLFRSLDTNGNMEDTQSYVIKVNTLGKNILKRRIINSTFTVL
jgi:murein DD-endopeptidase MepM/ murein hydrolase activator NlpD/photosystem II stability/assembly factor-like uncharacterized protein